MQGPEAAQVKEAPARRSIPMGFSSEQDTMWSWSWSSDPHVNHPIPMYRPSSVLSGGSSCAVSRPNCAGLRGYRPDYHRSGFGLLSRVALVSLGRSDLDTM
ncbi:hypothetical protein R1flu_008362 [Riccia fluitans]|uniref:Uncharacterized protein n=1 Tax=Riccia fluitans TaxID=41844 RepID=A0ABD1YBJ3_9MARC